MSHGVDELLAHAHQRGGAARREIEAAEELEPPRLGHAMHLRRRGVGRRREPGGDRGVEPRVIGAEPGRQRLEKGDARAGGQLGVEHEDFARERHARGFAAPRQQVLAELDEARRALLGNLAAVAGAIDQRAAALGNGLQHVAKKGRIHWIESPAAASD